MGAAENGNGPPMREAKGIERARDMTMTFDGPSSDPPNILTR